MNILFVVYTPGGDDNDNTIALLPSAKLTGVDLDAIDGKMVNADKLPEEVADAIVTLYKRLGLEREEDFDADLSEYVNPRTRTPFTVDKVVRIGWAV